MRKVKTKMPYILAHLVIGLSSLFALMHLVPAYAIWAEVVIGVGILMASFIAADRYLFYEFNTLHEIRNGNVAYAIMLLSVAVIVLAVAIIVG